MTRFFRVVAGAMLCLGMLFVAVPRTFACSGVPQLAYDSADLIVGGYITQWEAQDDDGTLPFVPINVTLQVDQQIKGQTEQIVHFSDTASLLRDEIGAWAGSSGACGVFDSDPRGQYVVLGLSRTPEGGYRSNRLTLAFIGAEPRGEAYEQAMQQLKDLVSPTSSAGTNEPATAETGSQPTATSAPTSSAKAQNASLDWLLLAVVIIVLAAALALTLTRRRP